MSVMREISLEVFSERKIQPQVQISPIVYEREPQGHASAVSFLHMFAEITRQSMLSFGSDQQGNQRFGTED